MAEWPTLLDVIAARRRIAPHIVRTPLHRYPALDALLGAEVHVKHENHQAQGTFKLRGAVNVVAQLSAAERERGVIVASTGNFGQGIAYAAGRFGVKAVVVVPEDANPGKVESTRRLGAAVVFHGLDFDASKEHAEALSREEGYRYIHSANEPGLIAGVGTYSLEIIEDLPDVEVIVVPVGGGSGACGACVVVKGLGADVRVVGVQAERAPAAYLSWREGRAVEAPVETAAEGLATGAGYELPRGIMRELLDEFVLVSEEELALSVVLHLENTHNLTEHAGAASLAAAVKIKDSLAGKKVVLVMSGGNITVDQLRAALGERSG